MQLSFYDPVIEYIYCSGKNPKGFTYSIITRRRLVKTINSIKAIKYFSDASRLVTLDHMVIDSFSKISSVKVDQLYRLEFKCNENNNLIEGLQILRLAPEIHFKH